MKPGRERSRGKFREGQVVALLGSPASYGRIREIWRGYPDRCIGYWIDGHECVRGSKEIRPLTAREAGRSKQERKANESGKYKMGAAKLAAATAERTPQVCEKQYNWKKFFRRGKPRRMRVRP